MVAAGLLASLPGVVSLSVLANEELGYVGTGASMALAASAMYLSVEQSLSMVVAVLSAVPVAVLFLRRLDKEEAVAASLLAIVSAGAARSAVDHMDGVCDNDLTAFKRRDYAIGLAYVLGTLALITLVNPQSTPINIAILLSSALVLAWSVTNASSHWMTLSILVAVFLAIGALYRTDSVPPQATFKQRVITPPRAIRKPAPRAIYRTPATPVNWM